MVKKTKYQKSRERHLRRFRNPSLLLVLCGSVALGACSGKIGSQAPGFQNEDASVPEARGGLSIPAGSIPTLDGHGQYRLPGGALVATAAVGGETFVRIHGSLSNSSFQALHQSASSRLLRSDDRKALLGRTLELSLSKISDVVSLGLTRLDPEVGYFSAWVRLEDYPNLALVKELPAGVVVNPVVVSERTPPRLPESLVASLADGRLDSAGFSGLERIGAVEFASRVEAETGRRPDGSLVLVGVGDTGLTLNHPSFFDEKGQTRVEFLADYTGEGAAYFSPDARFEVRVPAEGSEAGLPTGVEASEALYLTADYLLAPQGVGALPAADSLSSVADELILVSPELRALLTTAGHGARLGAISEKSFGSENESVDINRNGKTNDVLWLIAFPAANADDAKVYLDSSGTGDFRESQALTDWNVNGSSTALFAERVGFDFETVHLLDGKKESGGTTAVLRASLVGYDPGNHGSHVAGIILGRKTIANDSDDTWARGVAPGARLAFARVCANNGGCDETAAVIDLAKNGADLINLSLGGLSAFNDGFDVGSLIIDRLTSLYDTQFLISAGNSGPGRNTVGAPSVARSSLSIGATATRSMIERQYQWPGSGKDSDPTMTSEDFLLFFSSRGPTAAGGFKPNLTAPGTELSAIQLNAAAGSRSGLDVYWGTSMAAPTAAGAYALFLDAIRDFNSKDLGLKLPEDVLTIRRVLLESARAFDVTRFDPKTGEKLNGQYTWIDQGAGMINLPAAWERLKALAASELPPSFMMNKVPGEPASGQVPVVLDYDVRVLRKNPNGIDYSGGIGSFQPIGLDPNDTTPAGRHGRGIWIDHSQLDTLTEVQIGRQVPEALMARSDAGELHRQLVTTADEFTFEIVYFGGHTEWLRAGTMNSATCQTSSVAPSVLVIGQGAIDVPGSETAPGSSAAFRASSLYVCVDRGATRQLPPGDHGAFIKAYRTAGGVKDETLSFVVPVYLTIPNQKLSDENSLKTSGSVESFQVKRHYIEIPEGTSLARVRLTLPEAQVSGGVVSGCGGASLFVLEAGNTRTPPEFAARANSIARSCEDDGRPVASAAAREVIFERNEPRAGIWDLHVFGRYNFAKSDYSLSVDYANLIASLDKIEGGLAALQGEFDFAVDSASFEIKPSEEKSSYTLDGYAQTVIAEVKDGEAIRVADKAGKFHRSYGNDVRSVTVDTFGAPKHDIDLEILECDSPAEQAKCERVAASGTATDEETATFEPKEGKFYLFFVLGYRVDEGQTEFKLKETLRLKASEAGRLVLSGDTSSGFHVVYSFDAESSGILTGERFLSGDFEAVGSLVVRSEAGGLLTKMGVTIGSTADDGAAGEDE